MADNKMLVRTESGKMVRMNAIALKIAEKRFGVNVPRQHTKEVPIELLKVPFRPEIIKALEKVEIKIQAPNVSAAAYPQAPTPELPPVIQEPVNVKSKGRAKK